MPDSLLQTNTRTPCAPRKCQSFFLMLCLYLLHWASQHQTCSVCPMNIPVSQSREPRTEPERGSAASKWASDQKQPWPQSLQSLHLKVCPKGLPSQCPSNDWSLHRADEKRAHLELMHPLFLVQTVQSVGQTLGAHRHSLNYLILNPSATFPVHDLNCSSSTFAS
jgi:hypothetical protein